MFRMRGKRSPDVRHTVDFLCLLDVPKYFLHDRIGVVFIDQFHRCHDNSPFEPQIGCSSSLYAF
jgi:hypothetical protein